MKQVQEALKHIGIPVMAGVWRATTANQNRLFSMSCTPLP